MAKQHQTVDRKPGALPDIQASRGGVTFTMKPSGRHERLIIRCDANGQIWVSIKRQ